MGASGGWPPGLLHTDRARDEQGPRRAEEGEKRCVSSTLKGFKMLKMNENEHPRELISLSG